MSALAPYYSENGITIYHGDCREIVPALDPVDVVLTDPPYGLGSSVWDRNEKTPKRRWRLHHDEMSWDEEVPDVAWLLPRARATIIWGGHLFALPPARGWLVWNKIIRNWTSGVCELAWSNLDVPIDAFDYSHGQLANEGKVHPTQKPVPLMEWCILKAGGQGVVLDPFAGSGSTLVAAKRLGRPAVGIEREERYCAQAVRRLAQGVLDLST